MARRQRTPDPPRDPFDPLDGMVSATLDLHGLRAAEARVAVEKFLAREHKRRPGALIHIITGRGRNSERGPILRKAVANLMRRQLDASSPAGPAAWGALVAAWGIDLDGGGYLVRLKGPRRLTS